MNAKKKNKKANKPPNPNPPQNIQSDVKKEEKVEQIKQKCEVKHDVSPVEILSQNLEIPVSEIKAVESETPKKPKRNKGKNKKSDKEEENLEVKDKPQESEVEVSPNVEVLQSCPVEVVDNVEDPLGEASVVPSSRKKKNKKKAQDLVSEEIKPCVDDSISPSVKPLEIVEIEPDVQENFSPKTDTLKESKKKKNKKKNRSDSEKSDKSDNVLSCTSAFEKILAVDASKPEQSQVTPEAEQHVIDVNIQSQPDPGKERIDVETLLLTEEKETKADTEAEPKTKKKKKKDKKQSHEDLELAKQVVAEETPILIDVVTENVLPDKTQLEEKDSNVVATDLQKDKEPSPKAKAKIAKPVGKKGRGKSDDQLLSSENICCVESADIKKEIKNITVLPEQTKPHAKLQEIPVFNVTESVTEDVKQEAVTQSSAMKNISIQSDQAMGKKRKKSKSPKPQKDLININTNTKSNLESEKVDSAQMENISGLKTGIEPKDPKESIPDAVSPQTIPEQKQVIVPETVVHERPITPDKKHDDEGFETKTSKKKKKVPKTPIVEIVPIEVIESVEKSLTEKSKDKEHKMKPIQEEKIDVSLKPLLPSDIDIHSVRTESEASSCDLVPEVHFMRSASQQQLDTNNNTVIQEVTNSGELKLSELHLTPLIQDSGETPVNTPEVLSSGISMTEVQTKSINDEKTDIKSKMMEVNQDMEELRLSIERSLAEFTALDKCDVDSENNEVKKEKSPIKEAINISIQTKETIPLVVEEKEQEKASSFVRDESSNSAETPPICPARKDNKSKNKTKKKGNTDSAATASAITSSSTETTSSQPRGDVKDEKKEKSDKKDNQKSKSTQEKGKEKSSGAKNNDTTDTSHDDAKDKCPFNAEMVSNVTDQTDFEPIENFEDALTSSNDDVNHTFEMIAKDAGDDNIEFQKKLAASKPEISITQPAEDGDKDIKRNEKVNPVSQPKNLLGHTNIPVQSNRTDYKKEKNKTPNARQAKVKIKDSSEIETKKQSKESQTDIKRSRKNSDKSVKESFSKVKNDNEEYVYKYSFRKVFLQSACHVCNKDLVQVRVPCEYCNLIFYCGAKHKDEDWPQHQALCFAVSTLAHMKDQKHIYADAQNTTGQDYRLLRMQMIVSCEKVLKRRLVPWEQEIMLYPRMCADGVCREWHQNKLKDCDGCGQISYCASNPEHLPKSHIRWCKSYSLYQRLVSYQQTKGRLEPRLPTRVLSDVQMPNKMNEVLAAMYEEKIDMNDIQYASLTQLATAPLTTAYCLQLCRTASGITNGIHKKHPFTIHVVGAELQFEADALNKWETFFLHVRPDVDELRVVLISPALNPGHLPLNLLGKIKLCDNCQQNKRRVVFKFEDNKNYFEYRTSEDFINPDIICAFNPSIQRSSVYNGKDPWPASINSILKLKTPFIVTAYTLNELRKDIARIKQVSEIDFKFVLEPGFNSFASVRPDRNFISDDEMPLLFKNYCVAVVVGC